MQNSILSCKCGSLQQLVSDPESGEVVCSECGLVLLDRAPETRAEWRTFDSEGTQRIRTGAPSSLAQYDMGLATVIGNENKDSSGRRLSASASTTIQRLRTWDFRSKSRSSTQSLILAFNELARLRGKLVLSDAVIEKTAYLYRKAQEKNLVKGRSTSSVLAAAIYISCRDLGASRSLRDISVGTFVKRKDISRSYRMLLLGLDIKVPLVDPAKCIVKIANQAGISEKTKRIALDAMKEIVEMKLSAGKNPMGLAATILYISCLKNSEIKTQKDIAEAAGITEVTIRNRVKELKSKLLLCR